MRNFIKGSVDRELFKSLTLSLYCVYDALEAELARVAVHSKMVTINISI